MVNPLSAVAVSAENWVTLNPDTCVVVNSSMLVLVSELSSVAVRSLAQSSERTDRNESEAEVDEASSAAEALKPAALSYLEIVIFVIFLA
jgi:hypothetical protein